MYIYIYIQNKIHTYSLLRHLYFSKIIFNKQTPIIKTNTNTRTEHFNLLNGRKVS